MFRFVVFLVAVLFALPAAAQMPRACAPRADIMKRLSAKYSEGPVAVGVVTNGGVLEVLSTETGSTWTIIVTMPNGLSCMLATGQGWQNLMGEDEDPSA